MSRGAARRLAGHAGLLSIALAAAGFVIDEMWTFPGTGASATEIAGFAAAHRTALLVAMALTAVAVGLWLMLGVGVWGWLREATDGDDLLPTCFLVGLACFVTLLLAGFTAFLVLVYRAPDPPDPRLLYDLSFGLLAVSGIPTALALGAYAALAFGDGGIPAWTGWLAAIGAVAHLVLVGSLAISSGFFSLEGGVVIAIPGTLFAWVLAASVAMLSVERREPLT